MTEETTVNWVITKILSNLDKHIKQLHMKIKDNLKKIKVLEKRLNEHENVYNDNSLKNGYITKQQDINYKTYNYHKSEVNYKQHYIQRKLSSLLNGNRLTSINWGRMGEVIDRQLGALNGIVSSLGNAQVTYRLSFICGYS